MKVPSKKLYPGARRHPRANAVLNSGARADYYEIIKQPVALDDIKQLLDRSAFPSLEMVKAQFDRCFKNARKYNVKESQIWRDAKALQVSGFVPKGVKGSNSCRRNL